MIRRHRWMLLGLPLALAACASPKVHDEVQSMDHRLSCAQMEHEIQEMEKHFLKVEESKGLTLRNVLTTTLFFPMTMATYDNVDDAQQASRERQRHLMNLYATKGCADEGRGQAAAIQPIIIPIIQPAASAPISYAAPQPIIYEQTTPLSTTVVEQRPRYSASHIHNSAYLFE